MTHISSDSLSFNEIYYYKFTLNHNNRTYETLVPLFLTKDSIYSTDLLDNNVILYNNFGERVDSSLTIKLKNYDGNYQVELYDKNEQNNDNVEQITIVNNVVYFPSFYIWGEESVKLVQFITSYGDEDQEVTKEYLASFPILLKQEKYSSLEEYDWKIKIKNSETSQTTISSLLGLGEKNDQNFYSGVGIGKLNTKNAIFSIENNIFSTIISPTGTYIKNAVLSSMSNDSLSQNTHYIGEWQIGNVYKRQSGHRDTNQGAFVGKVIGSPGATCFMCENYVNAWMPTYSRSGVWSDSGIHDENNENPGWAVYFKSAFGILGKPARLKDSDGFIGVIGSNDEIADENNDINISVCLNRTFIERSVIKNCLIQNCTTNGPPQVTSDSRLKQNIKNINNSYESFFDALNPVVFNYKQNPNKETIGFVAQEVLNNLDKNKNNIDSNSIVDKYNNKYYTLNYLEFIPLNTWQIQKLKSRVLELENQVQLLNKEIKEIKK